MNILQTIINTWNEAQPKKVPHDKRGKFMRKVIVREMDGTKGFFWTDSSPIKTIRNS